MSKRYDVAIVVIDDTSLLDHTHDAAAAGEAESGQLHALFVRTHEVLRPHRPEVVVLWPPDPAPGGSVRLKPTLATGRVEGAILAAAGDLGIPSTSVSGAGVRAAGAGTTEEAVSQLCSKVSGIPSDGAVRRAVAATRTWRIRGS